MYSVFLDGLRQWQDRETGKLRHYQGILKKGNLGVAEKNIIEGRIKKLDDLLDKIISAIEREESRSSRKHEKGG